MARSVSAASLGRLPARDRDGHKGTFGTVTVVGGCCRGRVRYVGAPALSALGALRSGCGLCRVLAPEPVIGSVLRVATSATGVALRVGPDGGLLARAAVAELERAAASSDAIVLGPGLGDGPAVEALVARAWRGLGAEDNRVPVVLDADGLNALARMGRPGSANGPIVMTPHPGEARRLMKAVGIKGDPTDEKDRVRIAAELCAAYACFVALKGAATIVSDGRHVYRNRSGGPWLATGGTGDVLAGVIGGLLAQRRAVGNGNIFESTCLAVLTHGRAGDAWAHEKKATGGMLAAELAERVPPEVERVRKKRPGGAAVVAASSPARRPHGR